MQKVQKVRIEIWNKKRGFHGRGVYVGRPSIFGNPFPIQEGRTREEAVRLYREYLRVKLAEGGELAKAVDRLVEAAKRHGRLPLVCWCAPQLCHAEVIAEVVAARLEKQGFHTEVWVWGRKETAL
ncbi:DUF4326 domain-containing protein [Fervidobacterium sp.]